MIPQHTPGPWFTEALSTIGHCAIIDADGFTIANPSPMGAANARLIAAAPDLLAALQGLLQGVIRHEVKEEYLKHYPEVAAAIKAIAKATGA